MALQLFLPGSVLGKAISVGVLMVALMIPLSMLRELVSERAAMRDQAYETVAQGWGGHVTIGGPMLVIPVDRMERNDKGERVSVRRHLYVLPTRAQIEVALDEQQERRRVGIYEVPVYLARTKIIGGFDAKALPAALAKNSEMTLHLSRARLRLPLSDTKSLRELKTASVNERALTWTPAQPGVYNGIEADLDLTTMAAGTGEQLNFSFDLVLAGSRDFSVLPLGATTNAIVTSAWPDPKFTGFLPATRTIDANGFKAQWQVLELNRSYGQSWLDSELSEQQLLQSAFSVQMFQSVDVYQRSERAVKYALVFIALTFLTFFAWEQIGKVAVHPLQYGLIGLALSTFYLLLVALTEHIPFFYAYWTAAAALVLLLAAYASAALQGSRRGLAVGAAMTLTYAVLFMLVLSEQYALLMGAITLFVALAIVMLVTRNVRWYRPTNAMDKD